MPLNLYRWRPEYLSDWYGDYVAAAVADNEDKARGMILARFDEIDRERNSVEWKIAEKAFYRDDCDSDYIKKESEEAKGRIKGRRAVFVRQMQEPAEIVDGGVLVVCGHG